LVRRGLLASRTEAQQAIADGLVTIDGAPALKAATQVSATQQLVVLGPPRRYVSRGGEKLEHALARFGVDPAGRRCLDAGVSTGGFTDCLLQRGAASVLAYDVGYGQVHDRLRADRRVEVHERTNVRELRRDDLPTPRPDLLVADLSFISLALVLPRLLSLLEDVDRREAVVLVKPQFEADREEVGKGGVVRDPEVWERCLRRVARAASEVGWRGFDASASPLLGPAGNVEFLVHLTPDVAASPAVDGPDDDRVEGPGDLEGADGAVEVAVARAVGEGVCLREGRPNR
jgi:23S rRNA (cytidine1920-2'-O)/16S rRNA (cytidine1409-2'-O)-methyltransferase